MSNNDRLVLQPSKKPGFWVFAAQEHGIVITFEEPRFNKTQKVTLLDGDTFGSIDQAMHMPTYLREIADWLHAEHYDKAMPSIEAQRASMGQTIRSLRTQRGLTQAELARIEAGKYSVGLDILNKIANALGVEVLIQRVLVIGPTEFQPIAYPMERR